MTDVVIVPQNDVVLNQKPRIERHLRLQWEEAQNAFVLLYPEGMIKLNESAGAILSCCNGEKNIQEIITFLANKYPDVGPENIKQDILDFFAEANTQRWVCYD